MLFRSKTPRRPSECTYNTDMNILQALRINPRQPQRIAFIGAGGKSSALFQLARELADAKTALLKTPAPVIVTATTHFGAWQIAAADCHLMPQDLTRAEELPEQGVVLVTDEFESDRTKPISAEMLAWLHQKAENKKLALLIEADGSRQKPVKAPAAHEPPIPDFVETVVAVAGLSALGKPLDDRHAHRAELFAQISGLHAGENVTPDAIVKVLTDAQGGLKNIPQGARRVALLNQADTPELQAIGGKMARALLNAFDAALVGSLRVKNLQTLERCAGIILAAGESKRFGRSKPLLDWKGKPFVRHVAETALQAGLDPVMVVAGHDSGGIESALADLPVQIVYNAEYRHGQSASIKKGIAALPENVGAAIFLLADQPQIPVEIIRALTESHARALQPIVAPLVLEEKRANPVLFDRATFPDLMKLEGDMGGRGIFDKHRVEYLAWHDKILLFDVDTPEDYEKLRNAEI